MRSNPSTMYGMVNQGLEDLVVAKGGVELWEQIRQDAGVSVDMFVRNHGYPDEVTYCLVGAASQRLGKEPAQLLEEFGIHWVLHTAEEGYPEMMKAGGKSLPEFLMRLPDFHTRVSLLFPDLKPPEFRCSAIEKDSLHLHYFSQRPGLAPFVVGLIRGLGQRFQTPVNVRCVQSREEGADHEVFLVQWTTS